MAAFSALGRLVRRVAAPAALPGRIEAGDRSAPVVVTRNPRSRRLSLRVDAAAGEVRLTVPSRTAVAVAARFVADHRDWLADRVARLPAPRPFAPGAAIPLDGSDLVIDWSLDHPRGVARDADRLIVGGPPDTLPGRVRRWLAAEARRALAAETAACAACLGRPPPPVTVGDARGRWGSCASTGAIRYNWRLILAPAWVRAAVVAHECAHLVHPNHGPAFWAQARALNPDHAAARRWLAAQGAALHWVGRAA